MDADGAGSLGTLSRVLEAGNFGHARIPGKHGAAPAAYEVVSVVVPDEPGSLARLLTDVGHAGINLEDLHLEHGLGQAVGVAEISVVPASVEPLRAEPGPARLARARLRVPAPGQVRERPGRGTILVRMPQTPEDPLSGFVVAVDGPSGSGKSSVSKQVARSLGYGYLDTGAMYRALTWWCLHEGVDLADADAITTAAQRFPLVIGTDPDAPTVEVDGTDVAAAIRETGISTNVSAVATVIPVREILRVLQRRLISEAAAATGGVVAEGRDITTVVAPDAPVRILLTASEEARLARRSKEPARRRRRRRRRRHPLADRRP